MALDGAGAGHEAAHVVAVNLLRQPRRLAPVGPDDPELCIPGVVIDVVEDAFRDGQLQASPPLGRLAGQRQHLQPQFIAAVRKGEQVGKRLIVHAAVRPTGTAEAEVESPLLSVSRERHRRRRAAGNARLFLGDADADRRPARRENPPQGLAGLVVSAQRSNLGGGQRPLPDRQLVDPAVDKPVWTAAAVVGDDERRGVRPFFFTVGDDAAAVLLAIDEKREPPLRSRLGNRFVQPRGDNRYVRPLAGRERGGALVQSQSGVPRAEKAKWLSTILKAQQS